MPLILNGMSVTFLKNWNKYCVGPNNTRRSYGAQILYSFFLPTRCSYGTWDKQFYFYLINNKRLLKIHPGVFVFLSL